MTPVLKDFKKINEFLWELPKDFRSDMRVPARIFADRELLELSLADESIMQLANVATLPGIQKYALAMPDIHEGYGFPVGGVAAMSKEDGVISPGGIGYDINCGVRLLKSSVKLQDIEKFLPDLANKIQRDVPSGLGRGSTQSEQFGLEMILKNGAGYLVNRGFGRAEDLKFTESGGELAGNPDLISDFAKKRGANQLGTIGSGNHFIEVGQVAQVFDAEAAQAFGLFEEQVTILIHTGSRGFGHQVATDYIQLMQKAMPKYGIVIPDRELACAPFKSQEGQNYFKAMACAANFAWANRQLITYNIRGAWQKVLGTAGGSLAMVYDVAHNIAKLEKSDGVEVVVHRKGATRAFGPEREDLPEKYKKAGQPVLIPGSMGTASYVLVGTDLARNLSFSSSCHGAGRRMSRHAALKKVNIQSLKESLGAKGIIIRAGSSRGLVEEAPEAYKDIEEVVRVVASAGIAKIVAKLKPLAVIKG